jgi:CDI immunity protein
MKSRKRLPFAQWADINRTERFVSVEVLSGYRTIQPDDEGYIIYLAPDVSNDRLGQALLEALDKSRFIWPPDEMEFFKAERYVRVYRDRQQDFMRRYGYKTKREAYRNMDWCRVERSEGVISIKPHQRDKPEYWTDLPPDKIVILPVTTDAVVVGTALRLALDCCE